MKPTRIAGIILLALLWGWLVRALLIGAGGITLKNLFLIAASGIIIFVPIYKKWIRAEQE